MNYEDHKFSSLFQILPHGFLYNNIVILQSNTSNVSNSRSLNDIADGRFTPFVAYVKANAYLVSRCIDTILLLNVVCTYLMKLRIMNLNMFLRKVRKFDFRLQLSSLRFSLKRGYVSRVEITTN